MKLGTDFCILFVFVPLFIYSYRKHHAQNSLSSKLQLISVYGVSLYYPASIAFGVAYNSLFLIYIALFSCSLLDLFYYLSTLHSHATLAPTMDTLILAIILRLCWIVGIMMISQTVLQFSHMQLLCLLHFLPSPSSLCF